MKSKTNPQLDDLAYRSLREMLRFAIRDAQTQCPVSGQSMKLRNFLDGYGNEYD